MQTKQTLTETRQKDCQLISQSPCIERKRDSEQGTFVDNVLLLAGHYEFIFTCKMTHKVR